MIEHTSRFARYDCSSTRSTTKKVTLNKMPEFEQTDSQPNPAHSYSPSTDATKKPRTRRRSGGFKTEVASSSKGNMGEVNPADALKQEKLSGSARRQEERAERPARQPRTERRENDEAPRAQREPRAPRERTPRNEESTEPRAPRKQRAPREPREQRVTNPQPSEATLNAIKRVEAQIAERSAERDARRKEREKNRPAQTERKTERKTEARGKKPQPKGRSKPARKLGLFATILNFFGKFIGIEIEEKPSKKDGARKTQSKNGQNRGEGSRGGRSRQGGSRNGQSRQGGSRSGQNRRSGGRSGQGRRPGNEKPHSAKSLSNES